MPLFEFVGKAEIVAPEQTADTCAKVAATFGVTIIVICFLQVTPFVVTSHQ